MGALLLYLGVLQEHHVTDSEVLASEDSCESPGKRQNMGIISYYSLLFRRRVVIGICCCSAFVGARGTNGPVVAPQDARVLYSVDVLLDRPARGTPGKWHSCDAGQYVRTINLLSYVCFACRVWTSHRC